MQEKLILNRKEQNRLKVLNQIEGKKLTVDRAAQLLANFPALWDHPGVTNQQRESMIGETFDEIRLRGHSLVAVKPKPEYHGISTFICLYSDKRGEKVSG
jgi:hypothetical protein